MSVSRVRSVTTRSWIQPRSCAGVSALVSMRWPDLGEPCEHARAPRAIASRSVRPSRASGCGRRDLGEAPHEALVGRRRGRSRAPRCRARARFVDDGRQRPRLSRLRASALIATRGSPARGVVRKPRIRSAGRLSTQKKPASSSAFNATLLPEPDTPDRSTSCISRPPRRARPPPRRASRPAWRSMNSRVESMPRVSRMWLRTAASTSTARLRPGATASVTVGISTPRMSCVPERVARRSRGSRPRTGMSRCTIRRSDLARAHRGLAEDRADVEHAEPAHLEEVAQHRRAAPLDRLGPDLLQLHHVVGHESVAARDQFERELALADGGVARDQHADLEHVEEDAVQRGDLAQLLLHVRAQHVDHVLAGLGRGEHRGAGAPGGLEQYRGRRRARRTPPPSRFRRPRCGRRSARAPRLRGARRTRLRAAPSPAPAADGSGSGAR